MIESYIVGDTLWDRVHLRFTCRFYLQHLGQSYETLGAIHDDVWELGTLGTLHIYNSRVEHLRHSYGTLTGQYRDVTRLFHYCNRGLNIL